MRWSLARPLAAFAALTTLVSPILAEPILQSDSLNACQENSGFSASLFNIVVSPNNNTANVDIVAVSSVEGFVMFDVQLLVYGFEFIRRDVNPCDVGLAGLCPMSPGKIPLNFNLPVDKETLKQVPSIFYNFPDIDAKVKVMIKLANGPKGEKQAGAGESVACVEANISNGKTVDLVGVKWALAIVAGLALVSSAIVSGLGHQNAAAHVAANALSLFGFFQAQAMIGLTAVHLPPIAMSWTQDFQWSMGIIHIEFMQDIFTWYQRATGGTPSTLFNSLTTVSVQVQKRAVEFTDASMGLAKRSLAMMPTTISEPVSNVMRRALIKRGNIQTGSGSYIVKGIQRAAFRAHIESTNLFMTGLVFFCLLVIFVSAAVAAFKGALELAAKKKWMAGDNFLEFRNGWQTVLKGILFRLTLIGFPSMTILCLWEFTQKDSAAEVVLAVFFLLGMFITLGWASFKVIMIARRSVTMHHNPAYILFSDPLALNKWGFLYVQFRASAYYFILPVLGYALLKSMFVAFGQGSGTVQAIAFLIIEAGTLIGASVIRPWMDKKTNSFNIAICAMNFINSIFLMIFTEVFNQPPFVTGIVGVVMWIVNCVFATVLLIMLILSTIFVFFRENPDGRYQYMGDDRTSFMKSQTQLNATTELDALGATARGDKGGFKGGLDLDDDAESITSDSVRRQTDHLGLPNNAAGSGGYGSRGPSSPSMPLFPADGPRSPPRFNNGRPSSPFVDGRPASPFGGGGRPASPFGGSFRSQENSNPAAFRAQNNASPSPWQRGAGYD